MGLCQPPKMFLAFGQRQAAPSSATWTTPPLAPGRPRPWNLGGSEHGISMALSWRGWRENGRNPSWIHRENYGVSCRCSNPIRFFADDSSKKIYVIQATGRVSSRSETAKFMLAHGLNMVTAIGKANCLHCLHWVHWVHLGYKQI